MVPEASLKVTDAGLAPGEPGWFVVNARDARWIERPGRGANLPLTGWTEDEADTLFPQLGVALYALGPGEPTGMYHRESDAEAFLVLSGDALLVIEGQERSLEAWDFVHCPPHTEHVIIGAGEHGCSVVAMSAREHQTGDWGAYTVDAAAARHGVSVEVETADTGAAYARFEPSRPARFRPGWLPQLR